MVVSVDKNAGFCWGVVRAIDFAERELKNSAKLYSLGDVIHNASEVNRLAKLGMETISVDDFDKIPKGSKVLIRAHGEPPSTYKKAVEFGIELIDATCPVVTKVQERIKKFVDKNYQVVIFGKKDHAEVIGLRGVTGDKAIVVVTLAEALQKVDLSKPTVLFSQTTMDKETFGTIASSLKEKVKELVIGTIEDEAVEFHAKDTICGQVSGREKKLKEFALSNDVVIFTAGKKSSNGKVLYSVAKEVNPKTFFVETKDEIDFSWFTGAETVGITGATSTPQWVMEELKSVIEKKSPSLTLPKGKGILIPPLGD
ncbi:MAG: 4-hydroxy-3-methylbut-2-enyl diphosphate reductase [Ignavibacteria bacterium]|nr:4-hydroxy-3-methylbut-2-enyl diphosphate reductase [Ignavibacteria bacterium]